METDSALPQVQVCLEANALTCRTPNGSWGFSSFDLVQPEFAPGNRRTNLRSVASGDRFTGTGRLPLRSVHPVDGSSRSR